MATMDKDILEVVNAPGRVGILATADDKGTPNLAYFGSPRLNENGTLVMGLTNNRSLSNLRRNPKAAFLVVTEAPVTFQTPGYRVYLNLMELDEKGELLEQAREAIAQKAGRKAAQAVLAGALFQVTGLRPLVDMA